MLRCLKNLKSPHRLRKHEGTKPFACEKCDYKCITKWDLSQHDIRMHQKDAVLGVSNLTCEICGSSFASKKSLGMVSHKKSLITIFGHKF